VPPTPVPTRRRGSGAAADAAAAVKATVPALKKNKAMIFGDVRAGGRLPGPGYCGTVVRPLFIGRLFVI
jgi:hypothetical protein